MMQMNLRYVSTKRKTSEKNLLFVGIMKVTESH